MAATPATEKRTAAAGLASGLSSRSHGSPSAIVPTTFDVRSHVPTAAAPGPAATSPKPAQRRTAPGSELGPGCGVAFMGLSTAGGATTASGATSGTTRDGTLGSTCTASTRVDPPGAVILTSCSPGSTASGA